MRSCLQLLEAEVPSEPLSTGFACEPLNRTVLVVAQAIPCDCGRSTVEAYLRVERLDDYSASDLIPKRKRELNSPNVLTFHMTVHMIWTGAAPNTVTLRNLVRTATRLRLHIVRERV